MKPCAQALFEGIIDYAGLFPPAELAMEEAFSRYVDHRSPAAGGCWRGSCVRPGASTSSKSCSTAAAFESRRSRSPCSAGAAPPWRIS